MSSFEKEKAVGLALRAIVQDTTDDVKRTVEELYGDSEIGKICYKWHMRIVSKFGNMDHTKVCLRVIEVAFKKKINLDKNELWKAYMRRIYPTEYMELMNKFTQIPQLAARDLSDKKEYGSNPWG
jgi:hypothetical protein